MSVVRKSKILELELRQAQSALTRTVLISKYGRRAFDAARTTGVIVEILPRVYASTQSLDSMKTRISAAATWVEGRGVVGGAAACMVHGFAKVTRLPITVITTGTLINNVPNWLRIRRLNEPPRVIHSGKSVSPLAHALVQAWWDGAPDMTGVIADAARRRKNLLRQMQSACLEYSRLPRRSELTSLLGLLSLGVESYLEHIAATTVLNVPELQHLTFQARVVVGASAFRIDAFDERHRVAIEFDGAAFHGNEAARRRDVERDALLSSVGIATLRFTYEDVTSRPLWCRQVILATITSRTALP